MLAVCVWWTHRVAEEAQVGFGDDDGQDDSVQNDGDEKDQHHDHLHSGQLRNSPQPNTRRAGSGVKGHRSYHKYDNRAASEYSVHSSIFREVGFLYSSHRVPYGHGGQGGELWPRSLLWGLGVRGQYRVMPIRSMCRKLSFRDFSSFRFNCVILLK